MKVAMIGDIHFGCRNDSDYFHQFLYQNLEYFISYIKENKIDEIIQLGDVFDRRKYINFKTLHESRINFFDKLKDFPMTILIGNHDTFYKNTSKINSPEILLGEYSNIHIVKGYEKKSFGNRVFDIIGWVNKDNYDEIVKHIQESSSTSLIGHIELSDMPEFSSTQQGFSSDLLSKYDLVISGHYHQFSKIQNVTYLGCVSPITWKDHDKTKRFLVYDSETDEILYVPFSAEIFKVLEYNDSFDIKSFNFGEFDKKTVRVIISDFEKINQSKFNLFIELLSKKAHQIDVVETEINFDTSSQIENTEQFFTDTFKIINNYVDNIVQSERIEDKQSLQSYLKEIYDKSLASSE